MNPDKDGQLTIDSHGWQPVFGVMEGSFLSRLEHPPNPHLHYGLGASG